MEMADPLRGRLVNWIPLLPVLAALAVPWVIVINSLRVDWTVNPQYTYGWAVPLLCLYLFRRLLQGDSRSVEESSGETSGKTPQPHWGLSRLWAVAGCAALLAAWPVTRFIQQANPDWRLVAWAQALEVVGITLFALRALLGWSVPVFPIVFFLVAVPWPTLLEMPLIQGLTRMNVASTVELMSVLGIPALQHGNTIEVGTGFVGIDDACSGIRSFQASLMLSLFLGAVYRLGMRRGGLLVVAGFGLSFAFNVLRTSLLTFLAAKNGVASVSKWHDPAGVLILVSCFCCLLLVARWVGRAVPSAPEPCERTKIAPFVTNCDGALGTARPTSRDPRRLGNTSATAALRKASLLGSMPTRLSFVLLLWLGVSEVGVERWYRSHENALPPRQSWTFERPTGEPNLTEVKLPERARQMLRFSDAAAFRWDDGAHRWQVIFLEWKPGRVTAQLARFHNPEVCLSATGKPHETVLDSQIYEVKGLRLPFRVLRVEAPQDSQYLFYCIWEDRAGAQQVVVNNIDYGSRVQRACRGQRNLGQRALEISLQGVSGFEEAVALFKHQLHRLLLPNR